MSLRTWVRGRPGTLHATAAVLLWLIGGAWMGATAGTEIAWLAWTTTLVLAMIGGYHFTRAWERV